MQVRSINGKGLPKAPECAQLFSDYFTRALSPSTRTGPSTRTQCTHEKGRGGDRGPFSSSARVGKGRCQRAPCGSVSAFPVPGFPPLRQTRVLGAALSLAARFHHLFLPVSMSRGEKALVARMGLAVTMGACSLQLASSHQLEMVPVGGPILPVPLSRSASNGRRHLGCSRVQREDNRRSPMGAEEWAGLAPYSRDAQQTCSPR